MTCTADAPQPNDNIEEVYSIIENKPDSALHLLNQININDLKDDSVMKAKVFYYKAKIYENMGDKDKAITYFNKSIENIPSDSIKSKYNKLKMSTLICILIFSISSVLFYDISYRRKIQALNKLKAKDDAMAEITEELQLKITELQDARLKLTENVDKLSETRRQQQELRQRIFDMNEVVRKINEFKKIKNSEVHGRTHVLSDEEPEILSNLTDFLHNRVISKLKQQYPNLTKDDLYLCCLLSVGLSGAKIALMLDISDDALKKRKSRIKLEKLALNENVTLEDFLMNLGHSG